ncbi:hypothetical protein J2R78_001549 [Bradyrhizobium sp. USDA 4538]|nr:hypothetical protein [Bradyrhizobium sp. USDA 4538]MCP1899147.1 hypothetical protein [Bradyrhizobium sp. USDA 4537]MCP1986740.1 hypothetical protein [Bradyrhizobium sp. USDA 4539]
MSTKALAMPWRPRALRRSRVGWCARGGLVIVVSWSADVGMQDRRAARGALGSGTPIEIVGQDRFDRTVGARTDVDCRAAAAPAVSADARRSARPCRGSRRCGR